MTNNAYNMINLQGSGVNPATFSGTVYKPLAPNVALLDKSLTTLAAKKDEIAKGQAAIDQVFGQLEEQMYNDAETRDWLADKKASIQNAIAEKANEMDLYGAARTATKAAGEIVGNTVVIDRLQDNTAFEAMRKEVNSNPKLSKDVKEYFLATHPHDGVLIKDEQGNDISYDHSDYLERPAEQIDYTPIIEKAQSTIKEMAGSFSNMTGRKMVKGSDGKFVPDSSENAEPNIFDKSYNWKDVSFDRLFSAINSALGLTPGSKESLIQDYNAARWKYEQLNQKIENANNRLLNAKTEEEANRILLELNKYANDIQPYANELIGQKDKHILNVNEYIAAKVLPWVKAMSYSEYNTAWGEHKFIDPNKGSGSDKTPIMYDPNWNQTANTIEVDLSSDAKQTVNSVTSSVQAIVDKFGTPTGYTYTGPVQSDTATSWLGSIPRHTTPAKIVPDSPKSNP
ncbi:MAG: hypothetical protein MJ209_00180 [archaeon]|nr:hypothetical protein [archaeon]